MTKKKITYRDAKYLQMLLYIKTAVRELYSKSSNIVNRDLITLYWKVGFVVLRYTKQENKGIIEWLSEDLRKEFSAVIDCSNSNIRNMLLFAESYYELFLLDECQKDLDLLGIIFRKEYQINKHQTVLLNIPWSYNVEIIKGVQSLDAKLWYANKALQTIEKGCSRNILSSHIQNDLYNRQKKRNNPDLLDYDKDNKMLDNMVAFSSELDKALLLLKKAKEEIQAYNKLHYSACK